MRSSTRKTLGDWRIRRGVIIAPRKSAIGAITVRGWSSSAGSEANRCHRVVNGTDIRPRSSPTRRIACNTRRGALVILPRNTIGVVIAKGLRSPDRDGNCDCPIGLNTSERDDILRPAGQQRGAHPLSSSPAALSGMRGRPGGGGVKIRGLATQGLNQHQGGTPPSDG